MRLKERTVECAWRTVDFRGQTEKRWVDVLQEGWLASWHLQQRSGSAWCAREYWSGHSLDIPDSEAGTGGWWFCEFWHIIMASPWTPTRADPAQKKQKQCFQDACAPSEAKKRILCLPGSGHLVLHENMLTDSAVLSNLFDPSLQWRVLEPSGSHRTRPLLSGGDEGH